MSTSGKLLSFGKNFASKSKLLRNPATIPSLSSSSSNFCPFFTTAELATRLYYSSDPKVQEPWIPAYQAREGEPIETLKARLLYQSRKRGMLENGLLLSTFAAKFLDSMSEVELKEYDRLINLPSNDWDIYYWATGVKPIPKEFDTAILHKFIDHVRNADKESRIRQPDLN